MRVAPRGFIVISSTVFYVIGIIAGASLAYFTLGDFKECLDKRQALTGDLGSGQHFAFYFCLFHTLLLPIGSLALVGSCLYGLVTDNGFPDFGSGIMLLSLGIWVLVGSTLFASDIKEDNSLKSWYNAFMFVLAIAISVTMTVNGVIDLV